MRQEQMAHARGLLLRKQSFEHFDLVLIPAAADLDEHVEHHWLILWDLTGRPPYRQQNLSHPTQHLVINPQERSGLFGPTTAPFSYVLEGSGRVLGTKFRPGAFRAWYGRPVSDLTDNVQPIEAVFPRPGAELEQELLALNDPAGMVERIEALLRLHLSPLDARAQLARRLVETIAAQPEWMSVSAVAAAFALSRRGLQRLFEGYVGIGPKWVIDRYRMIEAVDALNRGAPVNLADLAARLGYFDQAHFSRRFQALTGMTPGQYSSTAQAWS